MVRLACLLLIAAQVLLILLYLQPTGYTAIGFAFVGNPLLAAGLAIGLLWWWQRYRRRKHATMARSGPGPGSGPAAAGG